MNTYQLVETALRDYPETRNSDRALLIKVWELQVGKPMSESFKRFLTHDAIYPDTITRTRRKLQQHGSYQPTEQVRRYREQKFRDVRQSAPRITKPSQMGLV
jgi:hypothetical protein